MREGVVLDRYWRLALSFGRGRPSAQVRHWRTLGLKGVVRELLGQHDLLEPLGVRSPHLDLQVLEACLTWADLPASWRRHGLALVVGIDLPAETLSDLDGLILTSMDLKLEWLTLSVESSGHALALTALRLAWTYRHACWEFLLRKPATEVSGAYIRDERLLLKAALGPEAMLPQPSTIRDGCFYLVGEAVWAGNDMIFVLAGSRRRLLVPPLLEKFLRGRELGLARLTWKEGAWHWQWVEADGAPVNVGQVVTILKGLMSK